MDIDRAEAKKEDKGNTAKDRVKFCLDQLEGANGFSKGVDWGTQITPRLTVEEVIGALVSAEQKLKQIDV